MDPSLTGGASHHCCLGRGAQGGGLLCAGGQTCWLPRQRGLDISDRRNGGLLVRTDRWEVGDGKREEGGVPPCHGCSEMWAVHAASGETLKAEHAQCLLWSCGRPGVPFPWICPPPFASPLHSSLAGAAAPDGESVCKLLSQALLFREPR